MGYAENEESSSSRSTSQPVTDERTLPSGYDSIFPVAYTTPKTTGGGIVGPQPIFSRKSMSGTSASVKNMQTGGQGAGTGGMQQQYNLRDGNTELMVAATKGDLEAAQALIKKGANVNAKNQYGSTALMGAAAIGNVEIIELLVKSGADVNARGKGGLTPLMFAVKNAHVEAVAALMNARVNVGLKDSAGKTALSMAEESGFTEIAEYLKRPNKKS